jgi:hypothetical protein
MAAAPVLGSSGDDDDIDLEGKTVTEETPFATSPLKIKVVDGRYLIRVYLLNNNFVSLLIPRAGTIRVRLPPPPPPPPAEPPSDVCITCSNSCHWHTAVGTGPWKVCGRVNRPLLRASSTLPPYHAVHPPPFPCATVPQDLAVLTNAHFQFQKPELYLDLFSLHDSADGRRSEFVVDFRPGLRPHHHTHRDVHRLVALPGFHYT